MNGNSQKGNVPQHRGVPRFKYMFSYAFITSVNILLTSCSATVISQFYPEEHTGALIASIILDVLALTACIIFGILANRDRRAYVDLMNYYI